ncbi:hypothetical protein HK097_006567, partial [Rhizophlyctis rosea]
MLSIQILPLDTIVTNTPNSRTLCLSLYTRLHKCFTPDITSPPFTSSPYILAPPSPPTPRFSLTRTAVGVVNEGERVLVAAYVTGNLCSVCGVWDERGEVREVRVRQEDGSDEEGVLRWVWEVVEEVVGVCGVGWRVVVLKVGVMRVGELGAWKEVTGLLPPETPLGTSTNATPDGGGTPPGLMRQTSSSTPPPLPTRKNGIISVSICSYDIENALQLIPGDGTILPTTPTTETIASPNLPPTDTIVDVTLPTSYIISAGIPLLGNREEDEMPLPLASVHLATVLPG